MSVSEDDILLAAEYVLGTVDADERMRVESMMAQDSGFAATVHGWERALGELNAMVGSVEPPAELWEKIRAAAWLSPQQDPLVLPALPMAAGAASVPAVAEPSNVIEFSGRVRRWRGVALATSALAASLAAIVTVQTLSPETLPAPLRPRMRAQTANVVAPVASPANQPQFVAVLQKGPDAPAFILTVDVATKGFTVRRVNADPEPGKSYELWLVSDKLQRPRSLGLIGGHDFTRRNVLASYDPDVINKATFAVTMEPEGGAPNGVATGPVVYAGKLLETVPANLPASR